MSKRPRASCGEKAMDLLARRSHFRRELESKLVQRNYDEGEVGETLHRLEVQGFLDDRRTAQEFVAGRLRRGPVGPRKLLADLGRRGVEQEIARAAVDEAFPDGDLEPARQASQRHLAGKLPLRDGEAGRKVLASLARHLEGKGFSAAAVGRVVTETRERLEGESPNPFRPSV